MGRDERAAGVVVRPAEASDAAALRALVLAANEEFRKVVPAPVFRNYLENLVALLGDVPPDGTVVLEAGTGGIVATGTVVADGGSLHVDWPPDHAVFRAMAVDPARRGTGLGSVLGRACVARAVAAGSGAVGLHTGPFMAGARRLYERLGFVRSPERDVPIDAIFGPAGEPYDELALAYRLPLGVGS